MGTRKPRKILGSRGVGACEVATGGVGITPTGMGGGACGNAGPGDTGVMMTAPGGDDPPDARAEWAAALIAD